MRISKILSAGFIALSLSFGALTGCAAPDAVVPTAAMPAGESYSGLWYTNFGEMKLTQKSDGSVRGTFDYKTGGNIEGTVTGGVLKFHWDQPGDFQVGRRDVSGNGYLVLTVGEDGTECKGEWGYGENYTGGGTWTGTKATEIYK